MQTLTRQLAETRDSLQYSNRLCEQLEVKLEESEESGTQLMKQRRTSEALLEKKSTNLGEMEKELMQFREERMGVQAELEKLRRNADQVVERELDQLRKSRSPGREGTPVGQGLFDDDSVDDGTMLTQTEEILRLKCTIRDLSTKLQNSVSQKRQLEMEMEELLGDNAGLSRNLEKMDGDMSTLQLRLEEARERNVHLLEEGVAVEETSPISLGLRCLSHRSVPVSTHPIAVPPTVIITPDPNEEGAITSSAPLTTSTTSTELNPASNSINGMTIGKSIFSELDIEYSSLQQQYQDLLTNCTCKASRLRHVKADGGSDRKGSSMGSYSAVEKTDVSRSSISSCGRSGAFRELFDELFATLRQTAHVADRLIEGKDN